MLSETHHLRQGGLGDGAITGQVMVHYAYDDNGNLAQFTDANGNATTFAYDALDRLSSVTNADGSTSALAYDRASNPVQRTDPNGNAIAHSYDGLNRRVETEIVRAQKVGGTTMQTFGYDGLSRQIAASDNNDPTEPADDSAISFSYDSLSNRLSEIQDGKSVISTWDGVGNRLTLVYPGGATFTYAHDALARVKTIADGGGELASYDYIGPGRVLRRTNGNGTYVEYGYDDAHRPIAAAHRLSSDDSLLNSFSSTYDRVGNRLSETAQPGDVLTTYSYDSLYRLATSERPGLTQTFTYDAAGNRVQETRNGHVIGYSVDEMNRYTSIGGQARSHDANGNLMADGSHEYEYDALDRLVGSEDIIWSLHLPMVVNDNDGFGSTTVRVPATVPGSRPAGLNSTITTHAYDALNRRVSRQVGSETGRYLYAGGRVIEERDGADALLATYIANLLMERNGVRSFYQNDVLGSVRALADAAGVITERVDYEAFGKPIFEGGSNESAFGNPNLFQGHRYDAGDGLYVSGGLRYDPDSGRGLQR